MGWHSRGYLPHFDGACEIQAITYRLGDALPAKVLSAMWHEVQMDPDLDDAVRSMRLLKSIRHYEDAGYGSCVLRDPRCAKIVQDGLLYFDRERYRLLDWCVMPNHVHVMIAMAVDFRLDRIVKSWKSFTAWKINRLLGRAGALWNREYHDRYIRNAAHFENARHYIRHNPVKAGLCAAQEDWPWSSAGVWGEKTL